MSLPMAKSFTARRVHSTACDTRQMQIVERNLGTDLPSNKKKRLFADGKTRLSSRGDTIRTCDLLLPNRIGAGDSLRWFCCKRPESLGISSLRG